MLKKNKKSLLLVSGLAGALITSTAAGVALSSCTTTSSSSNSSSSYTYVIDWSDRNLVNRLVVDENGLVYSDNTKTTIIALSPNVQITNITIPSTVKNIAGYSRVGTDSSGNTTYTSVGAFQDMDSLISITLQTGTKLQSIGANAFYNCANLMAINGDTSSLMTIGASAFYGCLQLKSINLSNVQSIGDNAFYNCTSLSGSLDLSNTLIIGSSAFYGAFSSTEETIDITLSGVLTIGASAFYQSNITSINITSTYSTLTIGGNAFNGCTKLATVVFANTSAKCSLTIGASAFSGCTSLATLTFPSVSTGNTVTTTIGASAFNGCTSLVSTHLSSVTSIGDSAFNGCTKLTTVTLPSNDSSIMTTIGANAFSGCTVLETFAPLATANGSQQTGFVSTSTMTSIGDTAFANTAIKSIDLTNFKGTTSSGVTTTGSVSSFQNIPNLTSVVIGSSITRLDASSGKGLFYGSGLEGEGFDITLPSSITGVNVSGSASAFSGSGVRSIDMSAIKSYWTDSRNNFVMGSMFNNCTKLEEVILKVGTTTIEASAFVNTPALTTVVIPTSTEDNVTSITGFKGSSTLTTFGASNFATSNFETIDLTDLTSTTISSIASSFTSLPTGAVVKLPASFTGTLNTTSFKIATTDSSTVYATVQYPNGVEVPTANISNGILSNTTFLSKISGSLDLTSNSSINSIGQGTFFGTSLGSLTLPASAIASGTNLFSTTQAITAGTVATATSASYTSANLPFGSNASLTELNYSTFVIPTTDETPSTPTTKTAQTLFESTSSDTWTKVQQIINSLSNYDYADGDATSNPSKVPVNLIAWANDSTQSGASKVNADSTITFTAATTGDSATAANISLTNTYKTSSETTTSALTINSTDETVTFMHNGILWTYKNDGSSITLTGDANMYKLTSTNGSTATSYLTFFNKDEVLVSPSGSDTKTTYYIPSQAKVAVTLTIATA